MEDKPRYSRVSDILDLAIFMSSKIQGVTINEIAERYKKYKQIEENEVLVEEYMTEDADIILVAYGIAARDTDARCTTDW